MSALTRGGGGNDMPWLHYIGTVDLLPSRGTAYDYELDLDIDLSTVAGFIAIPHNIGASGGIAQYPVPIANDHYVLTPNGAQASENYSSAASDFRYDSVNKKLILHMGTWKSFFVGLYDFCYVLKDS